MALITWNKSPQSNKEMMTKAFSDPLRNKTVLIIYDRETRRKQTQFAYIICHILRRIHTPKITYHNEEKEAPQQLKKNDLFVRELAKNVVAFHFIPESSTHCQLFFDE